MEALLSVAALCVALSLPATTAALAQQTDVERAPVGEAPSLRPAVRSDLDIGNGAPLPCPDRGSASRDPGSDPNLAERTVGPGNALTPDPDYGRC